METTLLLGYRYVTAQSSVLGPLGELANIAIPIFGVLTTYALMIVEWRTKLVRHQCLERGILLELELGIPSGLFHELRLAPTPLGVATQTLTIRIMYGIVYLAWLTLALVALSKVVIYA